MLEVVNLEELLLMTVSIDLNLVPVLPLSRELIFSLVLRVDPGTEVHPVIDHQLEINIENQLLQI